jgi:hypothetical protein
MNLLVVSCLLFVGGHDNDRSKWDIDKKISFAPGTENEILFPKSKPDCKPYPHPIM